MSVDTSASTSTSVNANANANDAVFDPSTVDISGLDFSDLEEKYSLNNENSLVNRCILCDGAPVAPESKAPVLKKVLTKLFSTCGTVEDLNLPVADGKTKGYLIIRFSKASEATKAVQQLNGKKLDVKHRLLVNKLKDIEEYCLSGNVNDSFEEPDFPEFKEMNQLNSWLLDSKVRDQFLVNYNQSVGLFWFKKNITNEPIIEPRTNWTSHSMKWSPKGKYLFSMFPQGIQSWGGPNFDRINKHLHPGVKLFDFSPNEKFLVTLSPEPIMDITALREDLRADYPFKPEDIGKKIVIWDISVGLPVKTFALPPNLENVTKMPWPLIKWSHDDKYCARQGPDAIAIYETENDFQLLDKKLVKVENIENFEFAPSGIKLKNNNKKGETQLDSVLAFWTPESENQSAKVSVMQIPSKEILRTIPLVQVSNIELIWNNTSKYLCCNVKRYTKSKKNHFSNLHILQLFENDIPVDVIELKELILNFKWEPSSNKFIIVSKNDQGELSNSNVATDPTHTTFYDVETVKVGQGKSQSQLHKWVPLTSIVANQLLDISWSPNGRFVILTKLESSSTELKFFDTEFDDEKPKDQNPRVKSNLKLLKTNEFAGLCYLEWESSGRYVAAVSSNWKTNINNGFTIYDSVGHSLCEEKIPLFKEFHWRPRPESLLTSNDKKRVRKNLKEFSAQFEENDSMERDSALRETILKRKEQLSEWNKYRSQIIDKLSNLGLYSNNEIKANETIETVKEVLVDESEEIIE